MKARQGDWLVVDAAHLGLPRRRGRILDIRGANGAPPYVVRWEGAVRDALVFPGPGTRIERAPRTPDKKKVA